MKKLLLIFVVLLIATPLIKTKGQATANSSGLTSIYEDAERAYVAQVQGGEMSKEEEERLLKNLSPEMKAKLEEVKKLNKNKYFQLLREASYTYSWNTYSTPQAFTTTGTLSVIGEASKERSEKMKKQKELEIDVELYALKYKNADNANQQKIKSDLQTALNQLFDIRELYKQEEVKQLEKRLQDLKESLQARKQNKNEIVQRKIQELLGDSKYLRWE